ncbi:hypothetical protein [Streptomyces sp. NPDC060031]|uniref:hypothetical protein n=1 Tax=Streptomyces sp. NPDC060031 TaxID=3347043 RepID=UPI0036862E4D
MAAAPPSPAPTAAMVIGKEQAEQVFNRYAEESFDAEVRRDEEAAAKLQTGPLLEASRARYAQLKQAFPVAAESRYTQPSFLIPAERDQPGYPRSFVVLSKSSWNPAGRETAVHYFVQEAPGGEWKAAAGSWVNDGPMKTQNEDTPSRHAGFGTRDKEIAPVGRDAAGAVTLSPTAGADREVCERYAEYMTFTAPDGEPQSEHFVPGDLTTGIVKAYNEANENLDFTRRRYHFEVVGQELPVVRLVDGKSLVTCSYRRTDHWSGKDAAFRYGTGRFKDVDALLGGGNKWWRDTTVRRSVTVTFEVPQAGPADVVGSNSLKAPLLSAEGTPR